jgi:hypothetical protein
MVTTPSDENNTGKAAAVPSSSSVFREYETSNLINEQKLDSFFGPIYTYLSTGELPDDDKEARNIILHSEFYCIDNGLLFRIGGSTPKKRHKATKQLIVPKSYVAEVLEAYHDDIFAGHMGYIKTLNRIKQKYYWQNMIHDVDEWVKDCKDCQTRKFPSKKPRTELQPLKPVEEPFQRLAIDCVGPLPETTKGNKYIVVLTDYLTRWPEAFAVINIQATTIARILVEDIFCRYGAPYQLLSDQGANFMSQLVAETCRIINTRQLRTSSYHPQTNGLCERFNKSLANILAMYVQAPTCRSR